MNKAYPLYKLLNRTSWTPYAILAIGWMVLLLPYLYFKPLPLPGVADEFSYLLAAQTYAEGRLTNPSPDVPAAFQSFHILTVPSYISKYLPGLGLQLALGILLGHPIFGVWLTVLISAWATFWMLRAKCPKEWAILGAFIYLLIYGLGSYFGHSYWGGSLFLLQGLLVVGSSLRLLQRSDLQNGLILGLGAGGMLLTRPVEGGVFTLVWLIALGIEHWRKAKIFPVKLFFRSLIPAGMVVLLAMGFLMLVNHASTGNALRPAYLEYEAQYSDHSLVSWSDGGNREERLPVPSSFEKLNQRAEWNRAENQSMALAKVISSIHYWAKFYLPFIFIFPVCVGLLFELKHRSTLGIIALVLILAKIVHPLVLVYSHHRHYTAAWAALLILLMVQGLRIVVLWGSNRGWKRFLRTAVILAFVLAALATYTQYIGFKYGNQPYPFGKFAELRENIRLYVLQSSKEAGKDALIVINYPETHVFDQELVYNAPLPQESAVIWTQFIDTSTFDQLDRAYPNREWWVFSYDTRNLKITKTGTAAETLKMFKLFEQ